MDKHIVHISNDYLPLNSGISTHLQNLPKEQANQGNRVTLLIPMPSERNQPPESEGENPTIVRVFYCKPKSFIRDFIRLTRAVKEGLKFIHSELGPIDIIHQHDNRATRLGATQYGHTHQIPVIWTNHWHQYFQPVNRLNRWFFYLLRCKPDGVIHVHKAMLEKSQIKSEFSCTETYIPNGVDTVLFSPGKEREESEIMRVFSPQRMSKIKGTVELAEACVQILQENPNLKIECMFMGSDEASNIEGSIVETVKRILSPFVATGKVHFIGNLPYNTMPDLYRKSDIVVLPLKVETENLSILEAFVSGSAVVASKRTEQNGTMIHRDNCILVDENNPAEIAESILELVHDDELRKQIAKSARETVKTGFSWSDRADQTLRFYGEILNQ